MNNQRQTATYWHISISRSMVAIARNNIRTCGESTCRMSKSTSVIQTRHALLPTRSLYRYTTSATHRLCFTVCSAAPTKSDHNATQASYFAREIKALQDSITDDIHKQLQRIANSVPGLSPHSRVLDAGAGDGVLIPHLQVGNFGDLLVHRNSINIEFYF